ncbi:MAG: hypothetical protein E6J74_27765 [Deltaproteobacteria bacterium]|nr:MAG: hypothetical protein E6J74_27765 [Deltaproteobacteria bacterium]
MHHWRERTGTVQALNLLTQRTSIRSVSAVDILILDDVQFIAGKERTQEDTRGRSLPSRKFPKSLAAFFSDRTLPWRMSAFT